MLVTYSDLLVSLETFSFRYRRHFFNYRSSKRRIYNVSSIDFGHLGMGLTSIPDGWKGVFQHISLMDETLMHPGPFQPAMLRFLYVKIPPKSRTVASKSEMLPQLRILIWKM